MDDYEKHLSEKLQNQDFKAEWDDTESEYHFIKTLIRARNTAGLTQRQLSDRTGIDQAILSRIETGKANPSMNTLKKLAKGLGKRLIIDLK
jgi:ribosome-binding protein aMBF1 (putative translation factor)